MSSSHRAALAVGVCLFCLDAPTYKLVRLRTADAGAAFGFSFLLWRALVGGACGLANALRATRGPAGLAAQWALIGPRTVALVAAFQVAGNTAFPLAMSLAPATNVLVVLALNPLAAALIARAALGTPVPAHTWAAAVAAAAFIAAVFSGSLDGSAWRGTLIALVCPITAGCSFTVYASRPGVDLQSVLPLSFAALFALVLVGLAASGGLPGAAPAAAADVGLLALNAGTVAVGMQLIALSAQSVPPAEVALACLLETAVSPFLVYLAVGEVPSSATVAAGALICATLAAHSLYERRLAAAAAGCGGRGGGGGAGDGGEEGAEELVPLAAGGAGDGGEEEEEEGS